MSRTTRTLLRSAVPPLLALALASALVHPLSDDAAAASLPSTGGHVMIASTPPAAPGAGSVGVSTSIPLVVFQAAIHRDASTVSTAVFVASSGPSGVATIVGVPRCSAAATPGQVTWLRCDYAGEAHALTVSVTLDDGRIHTSRIPVTSS